MPENPSAALAAILEPRGGSYVVILNATETLALKLGRLGIQPVPAGYYSYVGSAFGPGGVRARLRHHLGVSQRPHWHIDYLRAATRVTEIWYSYDPRTRECQWASVLQAGRGISLPFPGFGASDCACPAHLFYTPKPPSWPAFRRRLHARDPGHARLYRRAVPC